jgi:carboxymethylenebutenolidase
MGHFATQDEVVDADALVKLESDLFELGHEPEFWHYEGAQHGFAEPLDGEGYHAESASLAWQRTLEFLRRGRADHHNGTDHHN